MITLLLLISLIGLFWYFQKSSKNRVNKILDLGVLAALFLLPTILLAQAVGYTNVTNPPDDLGAFISWLFTSAGTVKGHGGMAIAALIITALMGLTKMSVLAKSIFDKLGAWKSIIPLALGAIAELLTNFPAQVTWASILSVIVTGATGTGFISVAYHHILDNFKTPTQPAA